MGTSPGTTIEGRSLLLRINPSAAQNLRIDAELLSQEICCSLAPLRRSDVIVFAPSDQEREGIGAGLGPIARIDGQTVIDQTRKWLEALGETGEPKAYLKAMLSGLRASQIFIDLEMWVDFICAIQEQDFTYPVDVPYPKCSAGTQDSSGWHHETPRVQARRQFEGAASKISLSVPNGADGSRCLCRPNDVESEPVDTSVVREAINAYPHQGEQDVLAALDAVNALLDDETNVRPGEWRKSQSTFCKRVSWDRLGASLFSGGRRTNRWRLGEKTLNFIEGNYRDEVTAEDRRVH